jgi:hypothetical protein
MDYYLKYLKYKNKYLKLKEQDQEIQKGGEIQINPVTLKGINYLGHYKKGDKNIILTGEVHIDLSYLDHIDNCNGSITLVNWLKRDVIPQFEKNKDGLDIFFEWIYKLKYKYTEEEKEKREKKLAYFYGINETFYNLAGLMIDDPQNVRIHTFDVREALINILVRLYEIEFINLDLIDNLTRLNELNEKNLKLIKTNQNQLIECINVIIQLNIMIFFENKKTEIKPEEIKRKIINNIENLNKNISMIEISDKIFREELLSDLKNKMEDKMEELIEQLMLLDKINYADIEKLEIIDQILPNKLFTQIYNKIPHEYQEKFVELNKNLIMIKDKFMEKYMLFTESYDLTVCLNKPFDKAQRVNEFELSYENPDYEFPDFNCIEDCIHFFLSVMTILVDVYAFGRMLKPYIKTCIYHAGLSHTKNIAKYLESVGFTKQYESNDINKVTWENINDMTNNCINVGEFKI